MLRELAGGADRVVVVDTETTGVFPSDRVVEIALVTLSLDGRTIDIYDTLVNPGRDVGPTEIHRVTAAMVADAPSFEDVAGDIAVRLDGACVAAHNLPFDARMVLGEFSRIGAPAELVAGIDTLRATGSRLFDACSAFDVPLEGAHAALVDAQATAQLLTRVADRCEVGAPMAAPVLPRSGRTLTREAAGPQTLPDPPFIVYLASRLHHAGVEANVVEYLELLDRAICDLHLDVTEREQLAALAGHLGLHAGHVAMAHRRFVNELVDAAVEDHEVTAQEYDTLVRVAAALQIDQGLVESRTRRLRTGTSSRALTAGMQVVFTGDVPGIPRAVLMEHAAALGLEPVKGVTKSVGLLVAADTDTSSGKGKKAHRYGIPVVAAGAFLDAKVGDLLQVQATELATLKVITCPDCLVTWTVEATVQARTQQRCECCRTAS